MSLMSLEKEKCLLVQLSPFGTSFSLSFPLNLAPFILLFCSFNKIVYLNPQVTLMNLGLFSWHESYLIYKLTLVY
jgi:hypothetical protein